MFHEGYLYESTGDFRNSSLRKVDPVTGEVIRSARIEGYFAEGLCLVNETLYLLTWKKKMLLLIDLETLAITKEHSFVTTRGEGWGITYSDHPSLKKPQLVVSDGSEFLHFWDTSTLEETKRLKVFDPVSKKPIRRLNELEFIEDELLANIWYSQHIARINVTTGELIGSYDFSHKYLSFERTKGEDVLNGIAYDKSNKELYVTGKLWRHVLRVKLPDAG